jgi:hypothetical protein
MENEKFKYTFKYSMKNCEYEGGGKNFFQLLGQVGYHMKGLELHFWKQFFFLHW